MDPFFFFSRVTILCYLYNSHFVVITITMLYIFSSFEKLLVEQLIRQKDICKLIFIFKS